MDQSTHSSSPVQATQPATEASKSRMILVDRVWHTLLVAFVVLLLAAIVALLVLVARGKFQSQVHQTVQPLFNATVQTEFNPTTNNQYEFNPRIENHYNITVVLEVVGVNLTAT